MVAVVCNLSVLKGDGKARVEVNFSVKIPTTKIPPSIDPSPTCTLARPDFRFFLLTGALLHYNILGFQTSERW